MLFRSVFGYLRLSNDKIRRKTQVYEPEMLIIMDDSLVSLPVTYDGLKEGGIIVINTKKSVKGLKVPNETALLAKVDATAIAEELIGRNIPNTAMLGAFATVTELINKEKLFEEIEKSFGTVNRKAAERAYKEVSIIEL